MAKAIVQMFEKAQTKNGRDYFKCSGTIDGAASFFDMWTEPELGKEYEGEIKETQYGKSFSLPRSGGGKWAPNPERDAAIVRQNSVGHATLVATTLANLAFQTVEDKKAGFDLAREYLIPTKVFKLADIYYLYSTGKLAAASSHAPAAPKPQTGEVSQETKDAVNGSFPEAVDQLDGAAQPGEALSHDVDPNDIPF